MSLRETQLILEQGITIGGKSLREHFEVINHQEAIKLVASLAGKPDPLTAFVVCQIHALVLTKIDDENAGQYRNVSVRIVGGHVVTFAEKQPVFVLVDFIQEHMLGNGRFPQVFMPNLRR